MKSIKALKKLTRIEGLLSNVIERYAAGDQNMKAVLDDAKDAVIRVKAAVGLQESSEAKNTSVKAAKPNRRRQAAVRGTTGSPSKATAEPSKPKRKLSKAGRAAIAAASKKRWALKRAEAAKVRAPFKKEVATKESTAKVAVVKARPTKAAKMAPGNKAAETKATAKMMAPPPAPVVAASAQE